MAKKIAILQSSYIPWRGVFDFIDQVDEFVIYDDVQFVKRHWHNRNVIKTGNGPIWLSIPVETKGRYLQTIDETRVAAPWTVSHWRSIELAYRKAPRFHEQAERIAALYAQAAAMERLSEVNHLFLSSIATLLGIGTPLTWSSQYQAEGRKTDRLLAICREAGADHYLSGPSARSYIEPERFAEAGVTLEWMEYGHYRPYPQLHGDFVGAVSVLDMIFNIGSTETLARLRAERGTAAQGA